MISMKCQNCGGEMSIDAKGEVVCPYCGSRVHLSDRELAEYREFRLNMLQYLRSAADLAADRADTGMWANCENLFFYADDGTRISVDYLFRSVIDGAEVYTARDSVVFVFGPKDGDKAPRMLSGIDLLAYPAADVYHLDRYFPSLKARFALKGGGTLLAFSKPENVYPVFAFGSLRPEHAAWIVSRLENICCVLEFSGLVHGGISIDSVYINPRTHEGFLYGGWWNARRKKPAPDQEDLYAVRRLADRIMGEYRDSAPPQFRRFIAGAPEEDAFRDFALWDEVIEKGFGGHKFTKFSTQ